MKEPVGLRNGILLKGIIKVGRIWKSKSADNYF